MQGNLYHSRMIQDTWPHAATLRQIRGNLSAERAARMIDVTRQTWVQWERGNQTPSQDSLARIVEAFNVPPAMIGYEAPQGWELVPSDWIRTELEQINTKLDHILANTTATRRKR